MKTPSPTARRATPSTTARICNRTCMAHFELAVMEDGTMCLFCEKCGKPMGRYKVVRE